MANFACQLFYKSESSAAKFGFIKLDSEVNYHTVELEDIRVVNPIGENITGIGKATFRVEQMQRWAQDWIMKPLRQATF